MTRNRYRYSISILHNIYYATDILFYYLISLQALFISAISIYRDNRFEKKTSALIKIYCLGNTFILQAFMCMPQSKNACYFFSLLFS